MIAEVCTVVSVEKLTGCDGVASTRRRSGQCGLERAWDSTTRAVGMLPADSDAMGCCGAENSLPRRLGVCSTDASPETLVPSNPRPLPPTMAAKRLPRIVELGWWTEAECVAGGLVSTPTAVAVAQGLSVLGGAAAVDDAGESILVDAARALRPCVDTPAPRPGKTKRLLN